MIIIHFAWHSVQLKGCVSVTSLKEIAKHKGVNIFSLFTKNKKGSHYSITVDGVYDTALDHERVLLFSTSEKEADDFLIEKKYFIKPSIVELMNNE